MPVALILAFLISLGIHAGILFCPHFGLRPAPVAEQQLQVELKPMPVASPPSQSPRQPISATQAVPKQPSERSLAKKSARPKQAKPRVADKQQVITAPITAAPDAARTFAVSPQDISTETGVSAESETAEGEPGASVASTAPAESATVWDFPPRGQILYRVDRGDQEFEIGRAVSDWEISGDTYILRLQMQTTGLVRLFKSYRIDMESRGRLTAAGLQPESFSIRRNGQEAKEKATFDWQRMLVQVGDKAPQALDFGAQDLLSFNFHLGFMLNPEVARYLPVATGKKYASYPLVAVGDETVDLPMGNVRTLHLRSAGENMTELWLAYDYLLLPVKIRHVDNQGGSFVQVATAIRVGGETAP